MGGAAVSELTRWVFERNGTLWHGREQKKTVREPAHLPDGPLEVVSIWVGGLDDVEAAQLVAWAGGIPACTRLGIAGSGLTDAAVAGLAGLEQITNLGISAPALTDDGLAHLTGLPNLEMLNFGIANFGRQGLAAERARAPRDGDGVAAGRRVGGVGRDVLRAACSPRGRVIRRFRCVGKVARPVGGLRWRRGRG